MERLLRSTSKKFGLIEDNDGVLEVRPALARVAEGPTELSQRDVSRKGGTPPYRATAAGPAL
jgi:hypothetical protein